MKHRFWFAFLIAVSLSAVAQEGDMSWLDRDLSTVTGLDKFRVLVPLTMGKGKFSACYRDGHYIGERMYDLQNACCLIFREDSQTTRYQADSLEVEPYGGHTSVGEFASDIKLKWTFTLSRRLVSYRINQVAVRQISLKAPLKAVECLSEARGSVLRNYGDPPYEGKKGINTDLSIRFMVDHLAGAVKYIPRNQAKPTSGTDTKRHTPSDSSFTTLTGQDSNLRLPSHVGGN